jgi:PKD repeat protein
MTPRISSEKAIAEIIGSLVLISIIALAFAILAMVLFSQPAPQKIPAVAISITNQSKIIRISHQSGDSILLNETKVFVNGVPQSFTCNDCGDTWSIGKTLTIDYSNQPNFPNKVDIVFSGAGTMQVLLSSIYLGTMTPTQTPVIIPTTPTPVTTLTTPPVGAPIANFTGTPISGTIPLTVTFTDSSTGTPTGWRWTFGDIGAGNTSTLINPSHTYTTPGNYSVTLTVSNGGGSNTLVRTGYITVNSTTYAQRVVAGRSTSYTDTTGKVWSADNVFSAGSWGYTGGSTYSNSNTISGTPDPDLYRSERYGNFQYQFTVPNGNYQVTLKFAEIYWSAVGQRIFNVNIEGTRVMSNVDLNALAGQNTAYDRIFAVTVSDGVLNIDFQTMTDNAKISSIEVVSDTSTLIPPVAGFSGTPTTGMQSLVVAFTDNSTNSPTSWLWNFGDGDTTTNTQKNPIHTYVNAGTYSVTLTATNGAGSNTTTQTSYIVVSPVLRTISASSTAGGFINPNGTISVIQGSDTTFTITPTPGYRISDVLVDGSSVGTVSSYMFTNVTADHTISASFAINAPTFTGVTPASGPTTGGTAVTITGTNLNGATIVTFGGTTATGITVINANTITATTPAYTAGSVNVVITNPAGSVTGPNAYTYVAPPTVTARSNATLNRGWQGYELITGTGFLSGAQSLLNTTTGYSIASTTCVVSSSTQMFCSYNLREATVSTQYRVAVINPDGQSGLMTTNLVNVASPTPTLTVRSPTTAVRGWPVSVTLTGTGFQPGATVNMTRSGVVINAYNIIVVSPTSITCTFDLVGATAATNWAIRVTNTDGQSSGTIAFTVSSARPAITGISPTTAAHGTTVSITNLAGTAFQPGAIVQLRNTSTIISTGTNVVVVSPTQITCTFVIPPASLPQVYNVVVTNTDGQTRTANTIFTVTT